MPKTSKQKPKRKKSVKKTKAKKTSKSRSTKTKKTKSRTTRSNRTRSGRTATLQKTRQKRLVEQLTKEVDLLREWQAQLEMIRKHPLTQAKMINEQLLSELNEILRHINSKLDHLEKLDMIIDMLKERGVSEDVEKAIVAVKNLTIKDRQVIELLSKQGPLTAQEVAEHLKLTRGTASLRLNKLYTAGLLDKIVQGKTIKFVLKTFNQ